MKKNSNNLGKSWLESVRYIIDNGHIIEDVIETNGLLIAISGDFIDGHAYEKYFDKNMTDWMVNNNFGSDQPIKEWGYSYGIRLYNFDGTNQIEEIFKKLHSNPGTKSATISLMNPTFDFSRHMPCVNVIDFKLRDNKLNLYCFFRSQDIGKKMCADVKALSEIQKQLAIRLSCEIGMITSFIASAHVYLDDVSNLKNVLKKEKLLK